MKICFVKLPYKLPVRLLINLHCNIPLVPVDEGRKFCERLYERTFRKGNFITHHFIQSIDDSRMSRESLGSWNALCESIETVLKEAKKKKRKFMEYVTPQISLKNFDPQKDKGFVGTIKLHFTPSLQVFKPHWSQWYSCGQSR